MEDFRKLNDTEKMREMMTVIKKAENRKAQEDERRRQGLLQVSPPRFRP